MFNKVILIGNLTRDIELRYTTLGAAIGNSAIAVNRKYTDKDGKKADETMFIDIAFFGKQAEIANQYLQKGSRVLIEGRLRLDQWQDNYNQNRQKHSIVVETMEMLGTPQTQNGNQGGSYNQNGGNYNQGGQGRQSQTAKTQTQRQPPKQDLGDSYYELDEADGKYDDNDTIPF